ncbi:MAG: autotransporter outer membrane beta-barrel domain-containing protein, partial [Candidatus Gastranaerophilales bacterium]|nr:autotransporter outer membrane beta-barrel domain-containing protein [Candidatus Gastranaerophilales bacterium]
EEGNAINIDTSGLINMANNVRTNSIVNNLTINNGEFGNGTANFAIDIQARSNKDFSTDTITANSIKVATKDTEGTIRISDYNLNGDIFGYDAPIDRHIRLGKIFKTDEMDKEIKFESTDKEIFTPIGYYKLNPSSANDGNYSLDLARYNPQVFRGQVATAASYMNQLVVNDTLFNRAQIRRYGSSYADMFKNKTAIIDGNASYERTIRDGQIWTEMFGNFETLKMSQSLDKVRNNSWGFIVGGDFGLREIKNGWSWMPTAYIAYNGGHQTFNKVGMWQNGAQAGFMGSFWKQNFMETALVYAGVYGTEMNVAGTSEEGFNYFFGAASRSAYDWNLGSHFKIQPSLTLAYNLFGQQNWHSDFGQMSMSSGFLNGFNVAPGVNFILQQESWSMYATIAYAWNFFGGLDGQAGNISLPHLKMAHGYLQYGFGMTKTFTDRFNMYAQATIRNVGRTGIICQGGLNWRL